MASISPFVNSGLMVGSFHARSSSSTEIDTLWRSYSDRDWPETPVAGVHYSAFGRTTITAEAYEGSPGHSTATWVVQHQLGWPARSLHFVHLLPRPGEDELRGVLELPDCLGWMSRYGEMELPLSPLSLGFTLNTLFYAAVLWLLICGPFMLRRIVRRRLLLQRGRCPACAYPMGESDVCTECGIPLGPRI